jgi:hypothetical protein
MNTSHQDLATCIYNHMKSKNLHNLIVSVLVSLLPFPISALILSRTKFAPRLSSKILQIRLTVRIGEEGQSYQHQSHVGYHWAVWSEVEVSADLSDSVRACRQPGGVFRRQPYVCLFRRSHLHSCVPGRSARGSQPFCCHPRCQRFRRLPSVIRSDDCS